MTDRSQARPPGASDTTQHAGRRGLTLIELLVVLSIIVTLIALLLPASRRSREGARRVQCKNNLKQIGLALHTYAEVYDAFPPAYTVDSAGKPLHSWRVLILPYLDQQALYDTIDLTKPWDDPANAAAYSTNVMSFQCPSGQFPPNHTTYLAVVTSTSFFERTESRSPAEITANNEQALMVIESPEEHAVHWMAPQDADEQIVLEFGPKSKSSHVGGVHDAFVDGSVFFLTTSSTTAERREMITFTGRETATVDTDSAAGL